MNIITIGISYCFTTLGCGFLFIKMQWNSWCKWTSELKMNSKSLNQWKSFHFHWNLNRCITIQYNFNKMFSEQIQKIFMSANLQCRLWMHVFLRHGISHTLGILKKSRRICTFSFNTSWFFILFMNWFLPCLDSMKFFKSETINLVCITLTSHLSDHN